MIHSPASILAIAPHPDDVELGAGATLSRFAQTGSDITVVVLSSAEISLPAGVAKEDLRDECNSALAVVGIKRERIKFFDFPVRRFSEVRQDVLELLVQLDRELEPELVLCPATSDSHQDHEVVANEAVRAFRKRTVLGYELPWNNRGFVPTLSISVSRYDVERKEKALRCYRSQMNRPYFQADLLTSMARLRASVTGVEFAESFEVVRMVVK